MPLPNTNETASEPKKADPTADKGSGVYGGQSLVDKETLQFRRSVTDAAQAYSICRRLIKDNEDRADKMAAIMNKYNDSQPWSQSKLIAAGQGWRHNRSTGFMSSMVRRIVPSYKQVIDSARVLTSSNFSDSSPANDQKVEWFRVETTKTIRRWYDWHNFNSQLCLENVLFGYAGVNWSDEYEWRPAFMRQDESIFPEGSPQNAKDIPLWMRRKNFLVHELANLLIEPEISESVGWNIKNVVNALNESKPQNRQKYSEGDQRMFADTVRESTLGYSYSEGVKVVEAYFLYVQEATGLVSMFIVNARDGSELMKHYDRFESMDEVLAVLAVEIGNGKLHGSKGAGRILYNTHVGIEQARNFIADGLYLAGLILMKGTTKGKTQAAITVQHPICVVGENYEVLPQKFEVDTEAFFALDRHLSQLAEIQVGAFMPGQLLDQSGKKRTASEINYVASVEMQIKEGVLSRFWSQYQQIIYQMQKRMYSTENLKAALEIYKDMTQGTIRKVTKKMINFLVAIGQSIVGLEPIDESRYLNKEAVDTCVKLLKKGMTVAEIFELGQCPPNEVTQDMSQTVAQMIDQVVARYAGNKSIRQQELMKRDIASKLGNAIAEQLIIPEEDNTIAEEATRMQILEDNAMIGGEEVPISPRDIDEIHMAVIQAKAAELMKTMTSDALNEESLKIATNLMKHFDEHLKSAMSKGAKKEQMQEQIAFSMQTHAVLDKILQATGGKPLAPPQIPEGMTPLHSNLNQRAGLPPAVHQSPAHGLSRGPINVNPNISKT